MWVLQGNVFYPIMKREGRVPVCIRHMNARCLKWYKFEKFDENGGETAKNAVDRRFVSWYTINKTAVNKENKDFTATL